jgi:transposase
MPYREVTSRDQVFLMPPTLDDFLPDDHPARFVAEFVDGLDLVALKLTVTAAVEGRPRYRPDLLLCCWLFGYMVHIRTSRQLERACTENVAFMWLTGFERPDHNTLWRFYRDRRKAMRKLFKQTVKLAVHMGMVAFALQAVDGTKIKAAAATRRTFTREELVALLVRVDASIDAMEAQNSAEAEAEEPTWRLPEELRNRGRLRECIRDGLAKLDAEPGRTTVNLTDLDARRMREAHGFVTGYNGQAVADSRCGILVAMEVSTGRADTPRLVPMLIEAEAMGGQLPAEVVADGGYYSGANIAAAETLGVTLFAPVQPPSNATQQPAYYASQFHYDPRTDTYTCPEGRLVTHVYTTKRSGQERRIYRGQECASCPVRAACTSNPRGRSIERMPWADAVERHRAHMATAVATERMRQRRTLIEPTFGSLKEHFGLRRFLLRGLDGVRAEWLLAGSAYNLRKLYRYWWRPQRAARALRFA